MGRLLRRCSPLLLLLLVVVSPDAARATTMIARSVEALTQASASVVRATTLSTRSEWDAQHRIVTTVRLRALENLAGRIQPGTEFEIQHFGGIVDGIEMTVIGGPVFVPAQEVVLFLESNGRGGLETVGLAQGKLEVSRDSAGREHLTRQDLDAVSWVRGGEPGAISDLTALRARVTAASRFGR